MPNLEPPSEILADLGEFVRLPEKTLKKLIEQGRRDAQDLDQAIRAQFELSDPDGAIRLR